ncbi:hypothetical protein AQUCO_01500075v1 [Aquilegia coerulea]|uniref:Helicase C-terminal domain-containing protein n=1 Tax=Aquilegia coerulea TaxID=218851 RepID=A0A2G5DS39_AQUCA|nr:hypothetical protein AQUCO_01500075v1 [Aquilegia coerulea]
MAIDTIETPSSPSPLPTQFSQSRHFYVAVDRIRFKMETLLDLLGMAGRRALPMVLCCSSRDELDSVCSAISNLPYITLSSLYSDQAESERVMILERFRQATLEWNQNVTAHTGNNAEADVYDYKSCVLVVTDACLPLLASGEPPNLARVLINFEIPAKKETYLRRMSTCLAADGIVINMVVGGEVVTLKSIEESSGLLIAEMPIHISEIL